MIIEIHGAGFHNKGAELMLRTTIAELGDRLPNATFAVDPTVGAYAHRSRLGLRQIVPPRWWMGSSRFRPLLAVQRILGPLLTQYPVEDMLDIYGGVALRQIDALIDVSGFAFTDQWGSDPIRDFTRLAKVYKKKQKPVFMLPQGFGPFNEHESRKAMKEMVEAVDRVYARDQVSLQHVRSVSSAPQQLRKAPDITLFYPKMLESVQPSADASRSCIIPNIRMLRQGGAEWGSRYEKLIIHLGNLLKKCGERVCLLVHDTSGEDLAIARQVQRAMESTPEIIQKDNPVLLKELIAESRLVVTSRYHGAVAAFSKGVPSLCLGWAHKYEMLYRDFGCSDHVISSDASVGDIEKKVKLLLEEEENDRIRKAIFDKLVDMKRENERMWSKVVSGIS